jgi:hypothetical protein
MSASGLTRLNDATAQLCCGLPRNRQAVPRHRKA